MVHGQPLNRVHIDPLGPFGRRVGDGAAVELHQRVVADGDHAVGLDAVVAVDPLQLLAGHALGGRRRCPSVSGRRF